MAEHGDGKTVGPGPTFTGKSKIGLPPPAMATAATQFVSQLNQQAKAIDRFVASRRMAALLEHASTNSRQMASLARALSSSIPRIPAIPIDVAERLAAEMEKGIRPKNIASLTLREQRALFQLSFHERFGTYNALPTHVARELTTATPSDVSDILINNVSDILGMCGRALTDMSEDVHRSENDRELALVGLRGIAALRDGHVEAAQALMTAVWDSCITHRWGHKKSERAVKHDVGASEINGSETLLGIYLKASHIPAIQAFKDDRTGLRYARHATVHRASRKQYTEANALRATTIATGVLSFNW